MIDPHCIFYKEIGSFFWAKSDVTDGSGLFDQLDFNFIIAIRKLGLREIYYQTKVFGINLIELTDADNVVNGNVFGENAQGAIR